MKDILWVGVGGGIGSIIRFKLSGLILHQTADWRFPLPTFVVNVVGCFVAALLWGLAEKWNLFGPTSRIFFFTGILGGFTTFSAFGLETVHLLRRGEMLMAALYVTSSVICGVAIALATISAVPHPPQ